MYLRSFTLLFIALFAVVLLLLHTYGNVPALVSASNFFAVLGILQGLVMVICYIHPDARGLEKYDFLVLGAALIGAVLLRALVLMGAGW